MLPPEILTFLRASGRILLVKGAAGTGKTLFAMALAEQYQFTGGDVLWAASRHADPSENFELDKILPRDRLYDYARAPANPDAAVTTPPDPSHPSRRIIDLLEGLATELGDAEEPMVVIDSIDGLMAEAQPRSLGELFVQLVGLARDTGARLVAIAETNAPSPVDHLADGIIVMEEHLREGIRERWATIRKMRGTALGRPVYPFTLAGGRFSTFVDEGRDDSVRPLQPPPRTASQGRVATAVAEWDRLLGGGFEPGTIHLVEVDDEVGVEHQRLMVPLVLNALGNGWAVIYVGAANERRAALRTLVSRHHSPRGARAPSLHVYERPVQPPAGTAGERFAPLERVRREAQRSAPVLTLLHQEGVAELVGDVDAEDQLSRWCRATRAMGGVDVLIGTHGERAAPLAGLADDRWRLERRMGAPVFRGIRPATSGYFVHWRNHKGFPETVLEPIQ